ncbi:hypothetical protein sscle_01g008430 [Sclerotinia sclerotiorum 1980 UF-70]|uniref:Epoxide hydrolase N-terminal domain-containing protein n=1 Tax=Sclerotinia sclerotiorum (strain ATCC 18683 / 1980 / Ss-1) TaxID=665079 RepID=A0A1D9PUZ3_SCLS1|nr:hypothetical protein sscle_01g008430 [Sclerotinia sclerotiorum 1980 UF-70]
MISSLLFTCSNFLFAGLNTLPISPITQPENQSSIIEYNENFKATFGPSPQPFKISVDPEFIEQTTLKASLTRYTTDINQPDFTDGPPRHNITTIRDYWVNNYSWLSIQDQINKNFSQYTTTVYADGNYTYPIPLHFVHHKSPRPDAIPLLFIHGWPGSFLEVSKMINHLTNPSNTSIPAFHVVAPSLPGYGFSPAPQYPGLGLRETGQAFNNLMNQQLGYSKYVIQGGDFGAFTLRYMAGQFPSSVVSSLSNFFIVPPNSTDLERYAKGTTSEEENLNIGRLDMYNNYYAGYRDIQQTRPEQLAIAMTDSPVGFAAWIYDFMFMHVDGYVWTLEEIITWTMMYYIPGPYAGMRMYKELAKAGTWLNEGFLRIGNPVGVIGFPQDLGYKTPTSWLQRWANVTYEVNHSRGGHFAAHEVPDLLLENIRTFWGDSSLSNVDQFKEQLELEL